MIKIWILRIVFFPLYIYFVWRRAKRDAEPMCKCYVDYGTMLTIYCKIHEDFHVLVGRKRKASDRIGIGISIKKSYWDLQILDKRGCILGQMSARMVDEDEGIILYADFDIYTETTICKTRVLRRNKIIETCSLPKGPIHAQSSDLLKIRHALCIEPKESGECAMADCQNSTQYSNPHAMCDQCATKQKKYASYKPNTWQGKELKDLNDKHLWNIIQAVGTGQWVSGKQAKFTSAMKDSLITEYNERVCKGAYTRKKVKRIKKSNKKWESEQQKKQDAKRYNAEAHSAYY